MLLEESVAIQQIGNSQIGLSLLGPTFPTALAGDSLFYVRVWDEILGAMHPAEAYNWDLDALMFAGFPTQFVLNQKEASSNSVPLGTDPLFLSPSLINPLTSSGEFFAPETGWISMGDSLEIYIYPQDEVNGVFQEGMTRDFLKTANQSNSGIDTISRKQKIPDWFFLIGILILFTLVWLEPRWD